VFLATLSSACSDSASLKWTEDVRMPDGRVVTLTRYQEFKGPYNIGDTPSVSDYWFEFKHPTNGMLVRWDGQRELSTVALMMREELPVLLVAPNFGGFQKYNCPNPSYLLFQFEHEAWRQVPLETVPVKKLRSNMTAHPKDYRKTIEQQRHHLSADDSGHTGGRFSAADIDFEPVKKQTFGDPRACSWPFNFSQPSISQ